MGGADMTLRSWTLQVIATAVLLGVVFIGLIGYRSPAWYAFVAFMALALPSINWLRSRRRANTSK